MNLGDMIFLDDPRGWAPREPASDPAWIKHVHCDGARFHVHSYSFHRNWRGERSVTICSECRCIDNKIAAGRLLEIGIKADFVRWEDDKPLPKKE